MSRWTPRPRPTWVERLNALGVDVPLHDLECDDDAFGLLVRSLDEEAELHTVGRLLARQELVRCLRNRRDIAATLEAHPDILDGPIDAPVFVTGTGRSGTSLLHELMTQDQANRVPLTWELLHPCPPPETATYRTDPRIAVADREVTFWDEVTPEYRTMHQNGGDVPTECVYITINTFMSDHWLGVHDVPSYARWLVKADQTPAYRFHRTFLQLLGWRCPAERWVLKAPSHLYQLGPLFAVYPDARVVVTHRDPLKVLGSITSLIATLRWQRSDRVDHDRIVRTQVAGTAHLLDAIPDDDRLVHVRYHDLVTDPWTTMRTTYDALGLELTDEAEARMRAYLAAKPKDRHGAHAYSFADTGLDLAETRARFARYMARFDVPAEA